MKFDRNSDAVTKQYAKLARDYDSRWSLYVHATTDATIKRLPSSLGSTLDIGCGTGALLSRLVNDFPDSRLTGVDASSEMLDIARGRLPHDVTLRECWAEDLPFEDGSFDTVVSCNMFHFIRSPNDALDEMLRVLRPNGNLVITDWCDDYLTCKLCDLYLRWFDPSHFRMYGQSDCRKLLQAANARQIMIEKFKITFLWGLMTATAKKHSDPILTETFAPLQNAT
jgi:ubiquinone/menaquinone biosynthesis C-methylase UbiE